MTVQSPRRRHDGRRALVVRGGWEGHVPVPASDRYVRALKEAGFGVTVSDSLDSYLDEALLAATDLVVQCWTMGTITSRQADGLSRAVRSGTGFAGWHGGIVDAFRAEPAYSLITGGQFVYHPRPLRRLRGAAGGRARGSSGAGRSRGVHHHHRAVLPAR